MITIDENLWVSQEWLRKTCQIGSMIEHVKRGGLWNRKALDEWALANADRWKPRHCPLVQINQFDDGKRMIQDGHHRVVSTLLGGRNVLKPEEYELQFWTYSEYREINIPNGWYTPYDPITEVRLEDIGPYKCEVRRVLEKGAADALDFIRANRVLYVVPRQIRSVPELALLLFPEPVQA